jgi:predicted TIM-barrel fold metal-dependent hydrolase
VPAVRADPTLYGIDPAGAAMLRLAGMCGDRNLPLMMAVRLEDGRQRHPNDGASPLEPWAVRALVRSHPQLRLVITHADRDFIEQVHWGATPEEGARLLWDISWIWGPPEDHLTHLVATIGAERFCFGTGTPLRLPETSIPRLDLTPLPPAHRAAIESTNANSWSPPPP